MYDPIVLQLGLAKVTNYEEVVIQLIGYEQRITANGKTIKENVFSATTNQKKDRKSTRLNSSHWE